MCITSDLEVVSGNSFGDDSEICPIAPFPTQEIDADDFLWNIL